MALAERQDSTSSELSRDSLASEDAAAPIVSTPESSRPPSVLSPKPVRPAIEDGRETAEEAEEGSRELQSYLTDNADDEGEQGGRFGRSAANAEQERERELNMKTPTPETYRKKRNALGMTMSTPSEGKGGSGGVKSSSIEGRAGLDSSATLCVKPDASGKQKTEAPSKRCPEGDYQRWRGQEDACGLNSKLETLLRASALMQDEETTSESEVESEAELDDDDNDVAEPRQRPKSPFFEDKTPSARGPKRDYMEPLSPKSEQPTALLSSSLAHSNREDGGQGSSSLGLTDASPSTAPWRRHMDYFFRLHQARADDAAAKGNKDQFEQESFLARKELKRLRQRSRIGGGDAGKGSKPKRTNRMSWGRSRSHQLTKLDDDNASEDDAKRASRGEDNDNDDFNLKVDGAALTKAQSQAGDEDHLSVIERVASRAGSTKSGKSSSSLAEKVAKGTDKADEGEGEGGKSDAADEDGEEEHLLLKGDEEDQEIQSTTARQRASSVSSRTTSSAKSIDEGNSRKVLSDAEKLSILISEFGESPPGDWNGNEEERFVRDSPAILFRRVMIKGYAALTTHRLTFLAFMPTSPSLNSGVPASQSSGGPDLDGIDPASLVIRRGPGIVHRPGLTKRKRKVWFELTSESLTAYPSSNELYEPLASVRNVAIDVIQPYHEKPNCVQIKVKGKKEALLEFETVESALSWQREIDAAVWHAHYGSDKVRISLPLGRILCMEATSIMSFASNITFSVLDTPQPTDFSSRDLHPHTHRLRERLAGQESSRKDPAVSKRNIDFGFTSEWLSSMHADLTKALKVGKEWRAKHSTQDWSVVPFPVIEIEGGQRRGNDDQDDEDGERETDEAMTDGKAEVAEDQHEQVRRRIIREFSLACRVDELKILKADIVRSIPSGGILAIEPKYLCFFRQKTMTGMSDIRVKLPLDDIRDVRLSKAYRWHYFGLRIQIRAHEDILFEVRNQVQRDKAVEWILEAVRSRRARQQTTQVEREQSVRSESPARRLALDSSYEAPTIPSEVINLLPKIVNAAPGLLHRIKPMKVICLTIGSRGDVQPYLALCKGLQRQGHECTIVSHAEYEEWVGKYGIAFRPAGGDPSALMKLNVETKLFSAQFFRESIGKFRHWLDELLRAIAEQCYDADLIIESPSTFGGIHVAEAIGCGYMRAFTMPWTRTTSYPQAFSVPSTDLGGQYNAMSYTLFDQILWRASAGQINRWRKHMLNLPSTNLDKLDQASIPFMYNFSPAVVPPPLDWGDRIEITGYWFLSSEAEKWEPPEELTAFLDKARQDDKKIAYIGFGSITISDPNATTRAIYEAVKKADVRAIVSKGWSARGSTKKQGEEDPEPEIPEECYVVDSIPHDWLFPRIDIALHHGGAGTTGASLRAGLVTLIHPFFGDQFFWSGRVDKLGAGLKVNSLDADDLAASLAKAAKDRVMVEKAQRIGESIRNERGVDNAIKFINTNLSLSKRTRPAMSAKELQRYRRRSSQMAALSDSGISSDVQSQDGHGRDSATSASESEAETDEDGDNEDGAEPTIREHKDRSTWSLNGLLKSDSWKAAATYPYNVVTRTSGAAASKSTSLPKKLKSRTSDPDAHTEMADVADLHSEEGAEEGKDEMEHSDRVSSPQPISRSSSVRSHASSFFSSPLRKDSKRLSGSDSPRINAEPAKITDEDDAESEASRVSESSGVAAAAAGDGIGQHGGVNATEGSSSPMRRGSSILSMPKNMNLMPSMPHMSMPHLPNVMRSASIAGLAGSHSGSTSNAKETKRERESSRKGSDESKSKLTEEEKAAQARTHKTAKLEDERRKEQLVGRWKTMGRWDLVNLWNPDNLAATGGGGGGERRKEQQENGEGQGASKAEERRPSLAMNDEKQSPSEDVEALLKLRGQTDLNL